MINLLFTSAGRRVELIQEFKKVLKNSKIHGIIVCTDMNELAPALYFADKKYIVPSLKDDNYIDVLIDICKKEDITLIIPTIDTELDLLVKNKEKFKRIGTEVLISNERVIKISQNKYETYNFFKSLGLKTPESYIDKNTKIDKFPCFIKPISGSSSINAFKAKNEYELEFFKYYIGDFIIQELIEGTEYTIDVFCDFEGNPIYITPRIRLSTRSGEVNKTIIKYDNKLIEQIKLILEDLKPMGPLTIQAIKNKIDEEYYFIEINARFGGGAPLSMKAGANSAQALIDLIKGEKVNYIEKAANEGIVYLRYDQSIELLLNNRIGEELN